MRAISVALVALLFLPPAAFAQAQREGGAGLSPGVKRDAYVKTAQERAGQTAGKRFDQIDSGHKGSIDRAAFVHYFEERSTKRAEQRFDRIDTNHDGALEQSEIAAWRASHQRAPRARAEAQ
ncbi:MAG TPA: EF-hand domain-containing protein [Stellaceae bacterium]|nr:EF-hand domain-containing protein [Stellaceae bacterium]